MPDGIQRLQLFSFQNSTQYQQNVCIKVKLAVKQILLGSVFEVADASLVIVSVFEDGLIGNR